MKKIILLVCSAFSLYGFSESYGSGGGFDSGGKAPIGQIVDEGLFDPWGEYSKNQGSKHKEPPNVPDQADMNKNNQGHRPRENQGKTKTPPPQMKQDSFENQTDYELIQKNDPRFPEKIPAHTSYSITSMGERESNDPAVLQNQKNHQKLNDFMNNHPERDYLNPNKIKPTDLRPYSEWPHKAAMRHDESNLMDWEMGALKMRDGNLYDNWGNKVGKHMFDNAYAKQNKYSESGNNFIYFDQDYKVNGRTIVKAGSYKNLGTGVLYGSDGNPYGKFVPSGNLKKVGYDVLTEESPRTINRPTNSHRNPVQIKGNDDLH